MVEGVLTDPTSIKLSDSTGAYGVKRNDTGAVVVADGVSMTKESTGVYAYTFAEPASGLIYTAWVEVVYDGTTHRFEVDITGAAADTSLDTAVGFTELQQRLARFLFGHRTTSGLEADDIEDIRVCIKDGLQSVYLAHRWSFLRTTQPVTTVAATHTYDLPAGFDAIEGDFTFAADTAECYPPIKMVDESEIRALRQACEVSSYPTMFAVVTATFSATVGSRRQVVFYPTPDAAYVLTAIMRMRPTMIDVSNPYPLGGEVLAPVIVESCLAAAERTFRDTEEIHGAKYRELLELAIKNDNNAASPDAIGYASSLGGNCNPNCGVNVYFDDVLV
jgi:hypothetical protein